MYIECKWDVVSKLLLIDDDVELVGMLWEFLQQEGFDVTVAHDGISAEQYLLASHFDLMVLDVMHAHARWYSDIKKYSRE